MKFVTIWHTTASWRSLTSKVNMKAVAIQLNVIPMDKEAEGQTLKEAHSQQEVARKMETSNDTMYDLQTGMNVGRQISLSSNSNRRSCETLQCPRAAFHADVGQKRGHQNLSVM